ncbi:MAG: DEAD/DEAH box helicase [Candidatus Micrarchaeia archaeon]
MPEDIYRIFLDRFGEFTSIQKKAIPVVEKGENCIITASTGTGKTEAAILPILKRISVENKKGINAIYVTPLRALNRDLLKRLELFCKTLGISIGVRHGDTPKKDRVNQSKKPPQLLITTPESIQNLLFTKNLRDSLKNLEVVIVDELHELYYNKRGAQLAVALERIAELAGNFQRVGISATIGDMNTAALFLCGNRLCKIISDENEKKVELRLEMPSVMKKDYAKFREVFALDVETAARVERLKELIEGANESIVFVNTRQVAESLGSKLLYLDKTEHFGPIAVHHSSLDKMERIRVEEDFKNGRVRSIIATSSLELGIDIGGIDLVIQYGSPKQVTRLLQRVGRSGHAVHGKASGDIVVASVIESIESAAIIKLAYEKVLEKRRIEKNPLDVLANQIVAIALEYKSIREEKLFEIISRSQPFANLKIETLKSVINLLNQLHLIKFYKGVVFRSGRSISYFIENISVIPDVARFIVRSATGNNIISSLNENFVANYIDDGSIFITKGLPWHVISIEKDTIFVEPSTNLEAAIPDWEGEDIPVSYEVANSTYKLLSGHDVSEIESFVDSATLNKINNFMAEQKKYFIPKENEIAVEEFGDYVIIYLPLGKLANELLSRIIGAIFTSEVGFGVSTRAMAYAVVVDVSAARHKPNTKRILSLLKEQNFEGILKSNSLIYSSELFRYKFIQIAKLFGIIEKKATVTKNIANRLIDFYKGTPVFDETLRDLYKNYYDLEHVLDFSKRLKEGTIDFALFSFPELSPMSNEVLKSSYHYRELMLPLLPGSEEVRQFVEGMKSKSVDLLCTFCGFNFSRKISGLNEGSGITCPNCRSTMISIFKPEYREVIDKVTKGVKLKKHEKEIYSEALSSAGLIQEYGDKALVALSTYGIGVRTAARVLKMLRTEYNFFVIDLIEAQKNYIKNRRFWKET